MTRIEFVILQNVKKRKIESLKKLCDELQIDYSNAHKCVKNLENAGKIKRYKRGRVLVIVPVAGKDNSGQENSVHSTQYTSK